MDSRIILHTATQLVELRREFAYSVTEILLTSVMLGEREGTYGTALTATYA